MSFFNDVDSQQAEFFTDPDLMGGETVTYCPLSGNARQITAIVSRAGLRDVEGVQFEDITVTVRNHATLGIDLGKYNKGGDVLLIAKRKGGEAKRLRITGDPIAQNGGMLSFKLA